ncbi:ABC transporter ATP-binding protein [Acidovorax sp. BL-A-41-H1]|uniref:ABC transporter ATP-binding protein n=1 Tax=Acidovorax sp. BL-A-41-H1 TaxID=3421102 RepID=UPI003F794B9B
MVDNAVVLQVRDLDFAYPGCKVLDGFGMELPGGLALVQGGESRGKSTLLRLLAGELAAQRGSIVLHGVDQAADPQAYAQHVFWADARSTSLDNLSARAWWNGLPARYPAWDARALDTHIHGFSLHEHADKPLYALSTGSKRKVLMAAALASGAALTLIDEPVSGLDKPSAAYLARALSSAAAQPVRVVLVAHYEPLPGAQWGAVIDLGD